MSATEQRSSGATTSAAPTLEDRLLHAERRARRPRSAKPLRRSRTDKVLAGVCGGIAEFAGVSASSVRWVYVATIVLSLGVTGVGYFFLWALIPADKAA